MLPTLTTKLENRGIKNKDYVVAVGISGRNRKYASGNSLQELPLERGEKDFGDTCTLKAARVPLIIASPEAQYRDGLDWESAVIESMLHSHRITCKHTIIQQLKCSQLYNNRLHNN